MRVPKKPAAKVNTDWSPEDLRKIEASQVASSIFCACSTCSRVGGSIHWDSDKNGVVTSGTFACPFPVIAGEEKPPCSIPVIAADVIDARTGGSADLTKYTREFVVSMIQSTDLLTKKQQASAKASAASTDVVPETPVQ